MKRKLVAASLLKRGSRCMVSRTRLRCEKSVRIIDNIIDGLNSLDCIDSIVLGQAKEKKMKCLKQSMRKD